MAVHFLSPADEMAAQRKHVSLSGSQTSGKKAKRQVGVEKWQCEFDHEHQSLLWLRCQKDAANQSLVATLYCEARVGVHVLLLQG